MLEDAHQNQHQHKKLRVFSSPLIRRRDRRNEDVRDTHPWHSIDDSRNESNDEDRQFHGEEFPQFQRVSGNLQSSQQTEDSPQLTIQCHCVNSTRNQRCWKYFTIFSLRPTTMSFLTPNKSLATPSSKHLLDISGSCKANLNIPIT